MFSLFKKILFSKSRKFVLIRKILKFSLYSLFLYISKSIEERIERKETGQTSPQSVGKEEENYKGGKQATSPKSSAKNSKPTATPSENKSPTKSSKALTKREKKESKKGLKNER